MMQCNKCGRDKCDVILMHRKKKRVLSVEEMRKPCKRHIPLKPFKQSLLILAMGRNPQGVYDVLAAHGFRLQELAERPYFRITLNEKPRPRRKRYYGSKVS